MGKRFTDTDIWDQDWFVELPSKYKLLWNYMKDKCDQVGIWRPNKVLAQRIIGEPLNMEEFLKFINTDKERIKVLPSGRWFLKSFFIFQYGETFSPKSTIHKGALRALVSNGIHPSEILSGHIGEIESLDIHTIRTIAFERGSEGLQKGFEGVLKGFGTHKDKDKDKDKDKVL
jgi:hypothetical protein